MSQPSDYNPLASTATISNPWTTTANAGVGSSMHNPNTTYQPFTADPSTFNLRSSTATPRPPPITQTPLPATPDKKGKTARRKPLIPDSDDEDDDEISNISDSQAILKILHQQTKINKALAKETNAGGPNLPVQLPSFHGRAGENIQSWLFQVSQIFKAKNVKGLQAVHYVAGCLKEAALHWYQNQCMAIAPLEPFDDFLSFATAIKTTFEPPHYQQILRRQLRGLKQSQSVQD
jgi:hypothetical protein